MRLLELCCGSKSISKMADARSWETLTLDNEPKCNPDLCMCITTFDPTAHGHFDWVHASPPCQEYSICMTGRPRRLAEADAISAAALRIIEHFAKNGTPCTQENPWTEAPPHAPARRQNARRRLLQIRPPLSQEDGGLDLESLLGATTAVQAGLRRERRRPTHGQRTEGSRSKERMPWRQRRQFPENEQSHHDSRRARNGALHGCAGGV